MAWPFGTAFLGRGLSMLVQRTMAAVADTKAPPQGLKGLRKNVGSRLAYEHPSGVKTLI
jgi:hypothetical protein